MGDLTYCLYTEEGLEDLGILSLAKEAVRSLINLKWKRDRWGLRIPEQWKLHDERFQFKIWKNFLRVRTLQQINSLSQSEGKAL